MGCVRKRLGVQRRTRQSGHGAEKGVIVKAGVRSEAVKKSVGGCRDVESEHKSRTGSGQRR
jgi:hypothetical protein